MSNIKVLLIDDDEKLCNQLQKYFSDFQIDCDFATHPNEGLTKFKNNNYEVVILDGMMPDKDGFEVCKEIRETSSIPIIMLTGRVEEADKIIGLEYGADDYVTKPFSPREIVARIKAQTRRQSMLHNKGELNVETLRSGKLLLAQKELTASYDDKNLNLTTQEYGVLFILMSTPHKSLTREEIMEKLHGEDWKAFDRALDITISRLRKKLKDVEQDTEFIKTVWGKGYMFVQDLS